MKSKGRMGIRAKLIAVIIPVFLVMIVSFFWLARTSIINKSRENLANESEKYTEQINGWVGKIFGEVQVYKDTIEKGGFKNDKEILEYMKTSVDVHEAYPVGLYMGDDSGVYLDGSGWVPGDDWVLTERDWYVSGRENKELAFGDPYFDSDTKQMCVSASVRMDYKPAVRVLATDVYLDYLSELISKIKTGGNGEAFLVTKNTGTILAHPDEAMVDKKITDSDIDVLYAGVNQALENETTGMLVLDGSQGSRYVCVNAVENTDWYLVTSIAESDVLSDLHRLEFIMGLISVVAAVVLVIVVIHMLNNVVRPVERVAGVLTDVADGDFTRNIEVKGNDEIAVMSGNMQSFLVGMRATISDIREIAEWLSQQSELNGSLSDSLMDSSRNQSEAVEIMQSRTVGLSDKAEMVSEQMGSLAGVIGDTRTKGVAVEEIMDQTVQESKEGQEAIRSIKEGMSEVEASVLSLAQQIQQTETAMSQIQGMVAMIIDISEETNLLSLNASIEAARAGEAGRGFAIVAEQIGKLATSSSAAADDIARLTTDIENAVSHATTHMRQSVDAVKNNVELVETAGATFGNVFDKVQQSGEMVEKMLELVKKVDQVAVEMQSIAKEQLATTKEISESAGRLGEYTKNVEDNSSTVAENAKELERESARLSEQMSQFRL